MLHNLSNDLRYAFRQLKAKPGMTIVAVAALALGIGANTAVFSIVNAVLLRPLNFPQPEKLMQVSQYLVSPANYLDLREQTRTFESLGAYSDGFFNLSDGTGTPERLVGLFVTPSLMHALNPTPIKGRLFAEEEGRYDSENIALISQGLWQRRFGAKQDIVGEKVTLNSSPYTIIGVLPDDIHFSYRRADIYLSMRFSDEQVRNRAGRYLTLIGRLRPEVNQTQAQAEIDNLIARLAAQYPAENADFNSYFKARLTPLQREIVGEVRKPLLMLMAAVSFVLLIACANIANLLLARALVRRKEIAIRATLGASRARLIRQLLIESLLLSLCGGLAGILIAQWGVDLLTAFSPQALPRFEHVGLNREALAFTAFLSLLTTLMFGLVPAFQATKLDLNDSLKESGKTTPGKQRRLTRHTLVVVEISLSVVLLTGAGLMMESFRHLLQVKPGFNTDNVLAINLTLPDTAEGTAQTAEIYRQILERVKQLPGVASAAITHSVPLSGEEFGTRYEIKGRVDAAAHLGAINQMISADYFSTMGIPLIAGRNFTDREKGNLSGVILINEALAKRDFPGEDPLGKQLIVDEDDPHPREIIGVVANVRYVAMNQEPVPELYLSYLESPWKHMSLVVKKSNAIGDPLQLIPAIRREISAVSTAIPVADVKLMSEYISTSIATNRLYFLLLGSFASTALVLAALGIYGVMSQMVAQRTREIGIRLALGAQRQNVFKIIIAHGMALTIVGLAAGWLIASALTRVLQNVLYDVSPLDPIIFASVGFMLLTVAALTCYLPARRATKIDPINALREE